MRRRSRLSFKSLPSSATTIGVIGLPYYSINSMSFMISINYFGDRIQWRTGYKISWEISIMDRKIYKLEAG